MFTDSILLTPFFHCHAAFISFIDPLLPKEQIFIRGYHIKTSNLITLLKHIKSEVYLHDGICSTAYGINEIKAVSNKDGITLKDIAIFNKVSEPNLSYEAPEAETGGIVSNWFQMPEIADVEIEEIKITNEVYSTKSTLGELLKCKETKEVIDKYLGGFSEEHPMFGMAQGMTIEMIASMAEDMFTEKVMYTLNRELTKIKK